MRSMALVAVVLASSVVQAEASRPNIIFILADDVGCEPLGCYGGTSFATPSIDALANAGLRFNHCYSMPVCHPTRTTFLTGRYPMHTGNPAWGTFPHALERDTIANQMKQAGYTTAVVGKWQLATLGKDLKHPHRMGFDEYCLFGWHEGPRYYDPLIWQNGAKRTGTDGKFGPDLYADYAIDFMKRHRDQPFFIFYSMAVCHDVTDDLDRPVPYRPGEGRYDNYAEMVEVMDRCVGRVVAAVDQLDLREKTLVVFTGDNGTAKGSIIRAEQSDGQWNYLRDPVFCDVDGKRVPGGKGNLTNDGTNVPLICSWPGAVTSGQTSDDLVDFSDFYETFRELGGAASGESKTDGRSCAARLLGRGEAARQWAYAESGARHWVRTQRWKLYNDGPLFDLKNDPGETRDLAAEPPPEAAEDLRLLRKALASL